MSETTKTPAEIETEWTAAAEAARKANGAVARAAGGDHAAYVAALKAQDAAERRFRAADDAREVLRRAARKAATRKAAAQERDRDR